MNIVNKYLVPNGYMALTIYPFIMFKNKSFLGDKVLINHERIHLKQQLELLIIPFFIIYFINYVINLIKYRNHFKAYVNIIFEKEAYKNERDLTYLEKRKKYNYL